MLPAKEAMQDRTAAETEQERTEGGETAGDVCIELHMRAEDFEKFFCDIAAVAITADIRRKDKHCHRVQSDTESCIMRFF